MAYLGRVESNFGMRKGTIKYPYILMPVQTNNVSYLLQAIEKDCENSIPIVFDIQGELIETVKIRYSLLDMKNILELYPFTLCIAPEEEYPIKSVEDLMELPIWTR